MKKGKKIFVLSGLLISFLLVGCDDTYVSSIPDSPVYFELDLTAQYPTFKNSANKSLTFINGIIPAIPAGYTTGYGGIIVCSGITLDDSGNTIYYAFDMSCPYEHKQKIRVYPNGLGQAICDSCKTVFDISDGYGFPVKGKATEALRRYKANLINGILLITR
jgi:hypothetical protein